MRVFHWRRKGLTSVINILAQALYSLFAADGITPSPLFSLFCAHFRISIALGTVSMV